MASRENDQLSSNTEDISITLRIPDYKHDGAAPATYLLGSHNVIEADSTRLEENGDKLLWEEKVFDSLDCADFNVSETTFAGLDPDYNKSDQTVLKTYNAKDVADDMRCSFEVSVVNDEAFLPHNKLCDIINFEVVSGLLRASFKSYNEVEIARMTAEVLGKDCKSGCSRKSSRLKIFAILIMMGKISLIRDFIDYEVMDKHLPLKVRREKAEKAPRSKVIVRLYKRSKDATLQESERDGPNTVDDLEPLKFSGLWSSNDVEDFESRQKTMCIPLFELPCKKIRFYNFRERPTLPFLLFDLQQVGGYGSVRKAQIHQAHYIHVDGCTSRVSRSFAVKELHSLTRKAYDDEMQLFTKIGARGLHKKPEHLIQLQFSYLHDDRYFLVFPWADGNLREFWKMHRFNPENKNGVAWLLHQCKGLTKGLHKIHTLNSLSDLSNAGAKSLVELKQGKCKEKRWGRHGDIKPENILWFQEYEKIKDFLVISDFGLTSFNTTNSRSKVRPESIAGYSGSYRPPELDLGKRISPKYDIWSLGCVFLEFISWFLLGYAATNTSFTDLRLEEERQRRLPEDKFFILERPARRSRKLHAKIKPSVTTRMCAWRDCAKLTISQWIKKLRDEESCPTQLTAFLDFIEEKMLVPVSTERPDCRKIMAEIADILATCPPDVEYENGINPMFIRVEPQSPGASQSPSEADSYGGVTRTHARQPSHISTSPTCISDNVDCVTNDSPNGPPSPKRPHPSVDDFAKLGSLFDEQRQSVQRNGL